MSEQGFRLSPQQRRLWQRGGGSPAFRTRGRVLVEGPVDREALDRALEKLVERHEILRTTYSRPSGVTVPLQVVNDTLEAGRREDGDPARLDLENGPVLAVSVAADGDDAERHVLRIELPALSADPRAVDNLLGELARAYSGDDEAEPLQYADVAEWANELQETDDERSRDGRALWEGRLPTGPPSEALPFLAGAAEGDSFRPETHRLDLDETLAGELRALRDRDGTVEGFLLACWWIALWRLGGSPEAPVGVVLDGRTVSDLEAAVGLFARVAPLPGALPTDVSFEAAKASVSGMLADAKEWQEYAPLDVHPVALFEHTSLGEGASSGDVTFTLVEIDAVAEPFAVKLALTERPGGVALGLHYDPGTFTADEVERLAGHLQTVIRTALAKPDALVGELEIQSERELERLIDDLNRTSVDYGPARTIHDLFHEQAQRTPEADAVVCGDERVSYDELDRRAHALCARLRALDVGTGAVVGLCVERSVGMVVGLLGILETGAAYLPLSPEHPALRLANQLSATNVRVVVTQPGLLPELPDFEGETVELAAGEAEAVDAGERPTGDPNAIAYVISTSGSTGVPKPVAIAHTSLVNYTNVICERLDAREAPLAFATVSPLGVDLGYTCLFPSLVSGGCLHVIPAELSSDGAAFARYLEDNAVDVLKIVPSHLHALLDGGMVLPRRFLILGGEAFGVELASELLPLAADGCRLVNHYGPAETTIGSLTFGFDDDQAVAGEGAGTVPIGRPIANTRVYVVDEQRRPVPVGVPGELWIGGAGVAQGYVNLPEQTAERFLDDPFSSDAGARVYRTGDMARVLPDGNVEFLGRGDDQVKIRGYRVELGEIEAALRRHPGVREAIVVVREETAGDKRLVAWLVPTEGAAPAASELRAHVKLTLPEHMIPSSFASIDELPRTTSGKVDRRALASKEPIAPAGDGRVAPRTPLEAKMAELWEDVIGVRPVGVTDDFFELGGHSLLALRLFSEIEKQFGTRLPLASLFEGATVADLTRLLDAESEGQEPKKIEASSVVSLQAKGDKRPFFCVHEFYGEVFVYRKLAAELGDDQPFYALRARGLEDGEQPFTSVEEMAAHYVAEIRRIQPKGPYAVGGLSGGGIIAYEMAQQLRAQSETVDLVALLDTRGRNIPGLIAENRVRHLVRALPEWLHGARDLTRAQWTELLQVKITQGRARLKERRRSEPGVPTVIDDVAGLLELSDQHRAVGAAQWRALDAYVPKEYPGRLTLFRARMQPLFGFETFDRGWRAVANGGLEITTVPGNHVGMLEEPHVRVLARELRQRLDAAPTS